MGISQRNTGMGMRGMALTAQDVLLETIFKIVGSDASWDKVRGTRVALFVRDEKSLMEIMERIARNQYASKESRDPSDCSLFYFALKKKSVVEKLWRVCGSHPEKAATERFLQNDFTSHRWKTAALKNAFALLGKRRFGMFS